MGFKKEIFVSRKCEISVKTGEIEDYDAVFFPNVIRRRELELIKSELKSCNPKRILEFCCGSGWLSKILSFNNYTVIGIDLNHEFISNARRATPISTFLIGDGMNLPFREGGFDAVLSISALHHLEILKGLKEIHRVSKKGGTFILMEPNKFNPFSAFGRKIFPMNTHILGEEQYIPNRLKSHLEKYDFKIILFRCLFLFSFPLARLFKILNSPSIPRFFIYLVYYMEIMFEYIPYLSSINSTIMIVSRII